MKTYILIAKLKITDETIRQARKWEKRGSYKYGNNVAHLVVDCIATGNCTYENEKVEVEE